MLLVSGPAEDLAAGCVRAREKVTGCVAQYAPVEGQVQAYLDQILQTDFSRFSIAEKQEIARRVNWLAQAGGTSCIFGMRGTMAANRVTKITCHVPKRSKGSIQHGKDTSVYTGSNWPELIVKSSVGAAGRRKIHVDLLFFRRAKLK